MIYADMPVADAEGAILAHSQRLDDRRLKKGHVLTSDDLAALALAGIDSVAAFRLEPGDVGEDAAAERLARACAGSHLALSRVMTGRCNLVAETEGILVYDRERIDALNLVDEALTVALLPPFEPVQKGQLAGTIKIIPFAVPETAVDECTEAVGASPLVHVAPFTGIKTGLIETMPPGSDQKLSEKLIRITSGRLESIHAALAASSNCDHTARAVAGQIKEQLASGCDLILIAGASAVTDRRDVIPTGIVNAGGEVDHFGMPVDPGNLLLMGHVGDTPVIGLPGCARSPKLNGFDWVLQRIGAGLKVTSEDIMRMGAGGLMKEIGSRPLPRRRATGEQDAAPAAPRIAAIILAAGTSSRMGGRNKLLQVIGGTPMIRRSAEAVTESGADPIIVVTGRDGQAVHRALEGLNVTFAHNPAFADGMAGSLKTGLAALPDNTHAAVMCLGDMPLVTADHIDRLIHAFDEEEGRAICVPTFEGKWGNPILWGRAYFREMQAISGDKGARELLHAHADEIFEVPMDDDGILRDFDTPEALDDL